MRMALVAGGGARVLGLSFINPKTGISLQIMRYLSPYSFSLDQVLCSRKSGKLLCTITDIKVIKIVSNGGVKGSS